MIDLQDTPTVALIEEIQTRLKAIGVDNGRYYALDALSFVRGAFLDNSPSFVKQAQPWDWKPDPHVPEGRESVDPQKLLEHFSVHALREAIYRRGIYQKAAIANQV